MLSDDWTPLTASLYLWHLADGLTHLLVESTYVYGCFRHSIPQLDTTQHGQQPASAAAAVALDVLHPSRHYFLGRHDRLYGNMYGSDFAARIWQEYAKADRRYAGIDVTTLSLEIVTVFIGGPLALYVAGSIRSNVKTCRGRLDGKTWFWAGVLAVGELYGG